MPNHVYNLISLKAKNDEAKRQLHTFIDKKVVSNGKKLLIDNESIIPLPDGIKKLKCMAAVLHREDGTLYSNPEYSEEAERAQMGKNLKEYGFKDWFDFCCYVWGSKWGFYDCSFYTGVYECESKDDLHRGLDSEGSIVIKCNTAWTAADGLLKKLCEMYPDIEMYCAWDEEQVTEYYGEFMYDSEQGFTIRSKSDMELQDAWDMLGQLGIISCDESDGYFIDFENNTIAYDENRDSSRME